MKALLEKLSYSTFPTLNCAKWITSKSSNEYSVIWKLFSKNDEGSIEKALTFISLIYVLKIELHWNFQLTTELCKSFFEINDESSWKSFHISYFNLHSVC